MSNLPPPLPTLPQPLIDAIAEYGFARTDGAHEAERIHRWSRLIAEIKIYARSYAEEAVRLERERLAKVEVHRDYSAGFDTRCKRLLVKARAANPLDGQIIMAGDLEQLAEIAIRARSQEGKG